MSVTNTISNLFGTRVASGSNRTASRVRKGVAVLAAAGAFAFAAPALASADVTPAVAAASSVEGPTIITEGSGNVFIGNTVVTTPGTALVTRVTG
jgi:K+ transporter